jgi:hypothetical protein
MRVGVFSLMRGPMALQIAVVVATFGLIAFAPPDEGTMLLVPIGAHARAMLVPVALEQGASLVARGPLPASVIVYGVRSRLLLPLARQGVFAVAAGPAGCGTAAR